MKVIFTDKYGQERTGERIARHTDYAVPMNEVKTDDGYTAMLKDSEIRSGEWKTAREMALESHSLSRDGMTATMKDGSVWKWSNHFQVWAKMAR